MSASVLFVAPSAYVLGGVATWLDYLVPALRKRGWRVDVALAAGRFHDVPAYERAHPMLAAIPLHNPTGSREGRVNAIAAALAEYRPDLLLAVNIADCHEAVRRARNSSARHSPRLLMTIHGIQPDLFDDIARERAVLDGVACSNRLAVALAGDRGVTADRVHHVPYGVQPATLQRASLDHCISGAAPLRIGYVGRIEQWQKQVFDLAGICDALHSRGVAFELTIAGQGPDEVELRARLGEHLAAGRVRWLGLVAAEEVASAVYSRIDVLLNTSLWETGPIVLWEAMAHRVAVVSSRYIGSGLEAALVDQVNCKLFDIGDVAGATTAIVALLDLPTRTRIAEGGATLVRERYGVAASVAHWEHALQATLSSPPLDRPGRIEAPEDGRLDRWLGPALGERVRRIAARSYSHHEPGGEWPHSYGQTALNDDDFWRQARSRDGIGATS